MPVQYNYVAMTDDGKRREGTIAAQGTGQVIEFLDDLRLTPIRVTEAKEGRIFSSFGFLRKTDYDKLIMFTTSLSTMYKAGIPLLRALSIIRIGKEDGPFNQMIDHIRVSIQSGRQLSEAMSDYPDSFPSVYTAGIAAGEESGQLDFTLDQLASMLEQEMELTRQLKSALRYPMIVMGIIVGAIIVMMTFVVPRFVDFYSSFGSNLPLPTKIIIGVSNFMVSYWPVLIAALIALVIVFRKIIANPVGRYKFDLLSLKIPVLGDLIIKGNVARFTLMFRVLFEAGLPIVKSLEILGSTIKNSVIAKEVKSLEEMFRRGQSLESLSEEIRFIPSQALQMMAIGLESGNLARMLGEIGKHYSQQVMHMSRALTSIIEPILTVVLGGFVLVLALAIFLPMWNLIQVFKG